MGIIPLKDWIYLGAILVLVSGFLFYRHSLIVDGEQICQAREKTAADKQAIADTKIAQDTTDALKAEIDRLRGASVPPGSSPAPVRVQCYASQVSAPTGKPGTARPGEPATPGKIVPEVSGGPKDGPDLGPSLQRFALAADVVSALDRACLKELKEP